MALHLIHQAWRLYSSSSKLIHTLWLQERFKLKRILRKKPDSFDYSIYSHLHKIIILFFVFVINLYLYLEVYF